MKMNSQILKFMLIGLTADNENKKVIPTETMDDIKHLIESLGYTVGIDCSAIIAYINSAVQSVLAEATQAIDKEWFNNFYHDWWLPLLNAAMHRYGMRDWQFAGLSAAAFRRIEDEAFQHHRPPYEVQFALRVLHWLPIKMVVNGLGTIFYTDTDANSYQAMVDAATDINEDNLMGLLGIEVNSHAKE